MEVYQDDLVSKLKRKRETMVKFEIPEVGPYLQYWKVSLGFSGLLDRE